MYLSLERTHILSGLLRCPICGSQMIIKRNRFVEIDGVQKHIKDYMCKYHNVYDDTHEPCTYEGRMPNYIIEPFIINKSKIW